MDRLLLGGPYDMASSMFCAILGPAVHPDLQA